MKKMNAFLASVMMCLAMTACSSKPAAVEESTAPVVNETVDDESDSKIDELMAQELAVFEAHQDLWDLVTKHMEDKNAAGAEGDGEMLEGDYVTILRTNIQEMQADLSEEDYKTLMEDCDKIEGIENELKTALGVE